MIVTVFRSRLFSAVEDGYGSATREIGEVVRNVPGHPSHKGFVAEGGERLTIVEFESEEALQEWGVHPGRQPIVTSSVIRHHGQLARQLRSAAIRRVLVRCFRMACCLPMKKVSRPALDERP